jgi:flagellar biosynthesis/type III secretory pathway protein FliH
MTGPRPTPGPFLACLPALDMETETGARQVLAAIRDPGASDADRKRLTAIILNRASDAARQILEAMMSTTEWEDDFIESYVQIGIEQGREQGLEQGLEQGAANAKAQDVLKVMNARGLRPTEEQRAKITATAGVAQLDLWFDRALTADTAADVFTDPNGE